MPRYLIYRHGANASNQSMTNDVPVAIVEADDADAALECNPIPDVWSPGTLVLAPHVTYFANQRFSAVPEKDVDPDDWNHVVDDEAMRVECADE